MFGRAVRVIAATAVLTLGGLSAASAGWLGGGGYGGYGYGGYGGYGFGGNGYGFGSGCCGGFAPVTNWGCGNSCAPLSSFSYGSSCCAPVRWGCGNPCGGYAYQQPIYVVPQGPTYQPPLTGYTYPVSTYDEPRPYPYVSGGYGYRGYSDRQYQAPYRPVYRPRVAHYQRYRHMGVSYPAMRQRPYYPRRGYHRAIELPPK